MIRNVYKMVAAFLLGAAVLAAPHAEGGVVNAKKQQLQEEAPTTEPVETLLGTTRRGGSALTGTMYDLNLLKDGSPSSIGKKHTKPMEIVKAFLEKGWHKNALDKFYHAPIKLKASWFYMPTISAQYIPQAFHCADKANSRAIVVVYRGMVRAPKTGKFRFVGGGDDVLAVRFNNQTVLEWGYEVPTFGFSGNQARPMRNAYNEGLRKMSYKGYGFPVRYKRGDDPKNPNADGYVRFCSEVGLMQGIPFEVKEGKTYPIEIMFAELGGGASGFFLLIEDMGGGHAATKSGARIYHIFHTDQSTPDHGEIRAMVDKANKSARKMFNRGWNNDNLEGVPFDANAPVWPVVKP